MSLFFVDSSKDVDLFNKNNCSESELAKLNILKENILSAKSKTNHDEDEDEDMEDYFGLPPPSVDLTDIFNKYPSPDLNPKSKAIESVETFARQMGWRSDLFDYLSTNKNKVVKKIVNERHNCDLEKLAKTDVEKEMKNAVTLSGHDLANFSKSDKQLQNERRVSLIFIFNYLFNFVNKMMKYSTTEITSLQIKVFSDSTLIFLPRCNLRAFF